MVASKGCDTATLGIVSTLVGKYWLASPKTRRIRPSRRGWPPASLVAAGWNLFALGEDDADA